MPFYGRYNYGTLCREGGVICFMLAKLQEQLIVAMKAHNTIEVGTLRMLISAVKNAAIDKYGKDADTKLNDADVLDVVKKQVKTHKESIEAFTNAGRKELADKEHAELLILAKFLPNELTDEELKAIVVTVVNETAGMDFGPRMGKVMAAVKGLAGGDRVAAMLKSLL